MLYYLIRPLVRIGLKLFLREIHFANLENIPKDKPVILAANHPTAFIEPCIMACFQKRSIFFLARGNLFGKRFYDFLLQQVHILPVYRLKDKGYAYVKNNFSTFEACYEALGENKMLMILAEGSTIHEKRLRPLVKGTGRIAFGTLTFNSDLEDVYIVPVGVNYTHADQFQSDLYVSIGAPISTKDFFDQHKGNKNKGILKLTQELRVKMLENIIHINNPKDDDGVEVLLEMIRPNTIKPVFRKLKTTDNQFVREKERVTKVNQLEQVSKALLWKKTMEYQSMLHALKIDENVFKPRAKIDRYIALLLLACFPAFMLGLVINIIPFALAKYIADTKNKYIEFYTSILLSAALGAYLIYWGALTLIASRFDGNWWLWAAISLPVLMVFCLYYRAYWKNFINNWRWGHCPADLKVKILKVRSVIIESIEG